MTNGADPSHAWARHYYALHDTSFNVIGLVEGDYGRLVERYAYTPYGERLVFSHGCGLLADINRDGVVNPTDLSAMTAKWNQTAGVNDYEDMDGDGYVNPNDNAILTLQWLQSDDTYADDPGVMYPRLASLDGPAYENEAFPLNEFGHQGLMHDETTGLIYNRARFRNDSRFLQRDPLGYPDGMNTYAGYHVILGMLDPIGLWKWADGGRGGGSRATIIAESGDTVESAAEFLGLNADESAFWLRDEITGWVFGNIDIECGRTYSVPNTVYVTLGSTTGLSGKDKTGWGLADAATKSKAKKYIKEMEDRGYAVEVIEGATKEEIFEALGDEDTYGWFFGGHGYDGTLRANGKENDEYNPNFNAYDASDALNHKLGCVTLYACKAGQDRAWKGTISENGILRASKENIYPMGSVFPPRSPDNWTDVEVVE